ncbi:MAG: amidohydrolase, partial [Pseudomonadota bacterium]
SGYRADLVIADGNLFDGGKIKKVYLQGKGKEFEEISPFRFEGNFDVNIENADYRLTLEKDKDQLSGFMVAMQDIKTDDPEKKFSISNVKTLDDQISFSVELPENATTRVYSFTGRLSDDQIDGYWLRPNLTRSKAQLFKSSDQVDKEAPTDEKTSSEVTYLSELTYPNRAFGLSVAPEQQNLHIKNATVWTSEDAGVLENTDIIIKNGKISDIGENLKTPRGYQEIDATGKHVTAGIIDEHSHIAISGGVNEGSDAVTSEVRIGDVVNPEDINIYRALAGGTTAAQLLHGSANPIGGQAQVIKLRWGEDADGLKFQQAPPSIKFALGENVKQSNWGDQFTIRYPQTRMGVDTIMRDIMLRALEYRESSAQYDALRRSEKKQTAPPRQNYRLDALLEIIDSERFIHAHSYVASEILALMGLAEEFGFTIQTFTHILEGYKVADEMAKHGASASSFADWWAYKFEVFDAIPGNTCLMMDKGVNVSVNSDSGDLIRRLNTEAAKSINYCGMDPLDAIKMVTINPAKQLKIDEFTGSLVEGKDADFVIWNANPLSIYAKVEQTWIEGRKYFDLTVDDENRQALAQEKSALIQKLLSTSDNGHGKSSDQAPMTHFASYLAKLSTVSNGSHTHSKTTNLPSSFATYLLKDNTVWHCDDNFDYWHYISGGQMQHVHAGGHH